MPVLTSAVLTNGRADELLRAEGFAKVPLISPEVAATLLAEYRRLRGDGGSGFEADLNNSDPVYREAVNRVAAEHLAGAVDELFVDHQPFIWNYLCKWPGDPEDLYLHRDWMFVDERRGHRSFSVWVALQDVGPDNGVLRVLPRSHRLRGELAGTDLAEPWLEHTAVIEPYLLEVPVAAGDAVVMDHATVHGSLRNLSGEPRVAIGCAVHWRDQPLVHFRRTGDASADRYDVSDRFFIDYTPEALSNRAPQQDVAERVAVTSTHLSEDELRRTLADLTRTRRPNLLERLTSAHRRR